MFKVGDKVVCIKQSEGPFLLPLNVEFTITQVTSFGSFRLNNDKTYSYSPERFILASEYVPDDPMLSPVIKKIRQMEARRKAA